MNFKNIVKLKRKTKMSFNTEDYAKPKTERVKPEFKGGAQFGRVVHVINMGLQHQTMWHGGQSKKLYWKPKDEQVKGAKDNQTYTDTGEPVTKVIFKVTVEFPKVRVKDVEGNDVGPAMLTKEYHPTAKALPALMDGFGGGNLSDILGKSVMATVGFTSGGNAKITNLAAAPEEIVVDDLTNPSILFDFYEPDKTEYDKLYTWIQEDLAESLDYQGSELQAMLAGTDNQPAADTFDTDKEDPFN